MSNKYLLTGNDRSWQGNERRDCFIGAQTRRINITLHAKVFLDGWGEKSKSEDRDRDQALELQIDTCCHAQHHSTSPLGTQTPTQNSPPLCSPYATPGDTWRDAPERDSAQGERNILH